jgi:DNA adenine methylase
MTTQVRSPLKWIGGKFHSAARILAAFPPPDWYNTYHEPCGGAAHVLMLKPNWGHREIYNDLNDDLCNFWLQVQNHADELVERLQALPYSRKLYYEFHIRLFDGSQIDPLERAAIWFYVLRGSGTGWIRSSPTGWNNSPGSTLAYRSVLDVFTQVQARLTHPRVIIDNRDIERVLEEYDSPTTLHYVDPPYIGAEYYYQIGVRKHAKKPFDHSRVADLLNAAKGYVALSYYPHPDLDAWYPQEKWRRLTWQVQKVSAIQDEASCQIQTATEMLLMNYPAATVSLWEESEAPG